MATVTKVPRWKASKFLHPFSERLWELGDLTCSIHEWCDLRCDPGREHVVRAVELCLTPSDSECGSDDEDEERSAIGGRSQAGSDSAGSDVESPIPEVAPVDPITDHEDHSLGELAYTMAPPFPGDIYIPDRLEPTTIDESLPRFTYDTLPSSGRHIRLLKIKPAIFLADVLDCELISVPLDDTIPSFDALSYCWSMDARPASQHHEAPSVGPRAILVNGKQLVIQESLALALHRYRRLGCIWLRRDRERWKGKAEYLWADGICIDQAHIAEKTTQVTMMGEIYGRARRVFIDLGHVPDDWISALHLMQAIQYITRYVPERGVLVSDENMHSDFEIPPPDHISWMALGHLLEMPWFRRTWVVQEVVLSERSPLVMFGRYCFRFAMLEQAVRFAINQGYETALGILSAESRGVGYLNLIKMENLRGSFHRGLLGSIDVLEKLRDFQSTDPRDKVFGVLTLLRDDFRMLPDYSSTVEDVYIKFAEKVVLAGEAARLLDSAGLHRRLKAGTGVTLELPSWVPEWRVLTRVPRAIYCIREHPYRASDTMASEFSLITTKSGSALATPALLADTIAWTTPALFSGATEGSKDTDPTIAGVNMISQFVDTHQDVCHTHYNDGSENTPLTETLARTLLMDDLYKNEENTISLFAEISEPGQLLESLLKEPDLLKSRFGTGKRAAKSALDSFRVQIGATLPGRKFAIGGAGYMGLVPAVTEPGDVVAVIPSGSIPYILRMIDDTDTETDGVSRYRFVGDSYIHGMMYGEVLEIKGAGMKDILIV